MSERQLPILTSPGFMVGLLVLLLNDFIFKQQFHNLLTGKLSDFAGLFVFPLFWTAFFPRLRSSIYILIAVSFIFWKSVYSQPIIDSWNSLPFFLVGRTTDYSDLFALLVLPFSYAYSRLPSSVRLPRSALCLIAVVSVFAFTATSFSKRTAYHKEYTFQITRKELVQRMSHLPSHDIIPSFGESDTFDINFDSCTSEATVTIGEKDNQPIITLKEINNRCPGGGDREEMLKYFEEEFIGKLREEAVKKSGQVLYIWPSIPNDVRKP